MAATPTIAATMAATPIIAVAMTAVMTRATAAPRHARPGCPVPRTHAHRRRAAPSPRRAGRCAAGCAGALVLRIRPHSTSVPRARGRTGCCADGLDAARALDRCVAATGAAGGRARGGHRGAAQRAPLVRRPQRLRRWRRPRHGRARGARGRDAPKCGVVCGAEAAAAAAASGAPRSATSGAPPRWARCRSTSTN
jgi:hypothetical protein